MTTWNQEATMKLIEEFHSRPLLWDVTSIEYKNRNKKRDALQELADCFKVSLNEVEKKVKNLKTQFRREHKALCAKKKSGSSPKKPSWFGYESLLFLLSSTESRGSRSTIIEEDDQEMLEILGAGSGERGLNRVKPGLLFLLRLAWESRARLPLLIMSGFMALGVRVQMEINIERAASFMPRLRLQEEELPVSDSEEGSDWTTDDAGFDSDDYEEDDEDDEDDEEEDEDYT